MLRRRRADVGEVEAFFQLFQKLLIDPPPDAEKLGDKLVYEASPSGTLFPHLYAPLSFDAVLWAKPLPLGADGAHLFPELDR